MAIPITRREIQEEIHHQLGVPYYLAREWVNFLIDEILEALRRGEKVKISGFGTFLVKRRGPRKGRNLHNGEIVEISPYYTVVFRPSRKLKRLLNEKGFR